MAASASAPQGTSRGYPVSVVDRLGNDAKQRLAETVIGHAYPVALTCRELAELLVRKLSNPEPSRTCGLAAERRRPI